MRKTYYANFLLLKFHRSEFEIYGIPQAQKQWLGVYSYVCLRLQPRKNVVPILLD